MYSVDKNKLGFPPNLCCSKGFLLRNSQRLNCTDSQPLGCFVWLFVSTINGLNAFFLPFLSDWTASHACFRCFQDLFRNNASFFFPCCFTEIQFAIVT